MNRYFMTGGAVVAGIAVALGAFGAHGLKNTLAPDMLAVFETGVRYLIIHAIALFMTGWFGYSVHASRVRTAGIAFSVGMLLFSGSLFLLALTGIRMFGAVAPIGGTSLIVGWVLLALTAWKSTARSS